MSHLDDRIPESVREYFGHDKVAHHGRGGLPAAQAHLRYIQRDGVTPEGARGRLYDRDGDEVDGAAFIERSVRDPHQFRFVVSADDSARLDPATTGPTG